MSSYSFILLSGIFKLLCSFLYDLLLLLLTYSMFIWIISIRISSIEAKSFHSFIEEIRPE